jgi:DNA-binding MarR family transcriptional regulator
MTPPNPSSLPRGARRAREPVDDSISWVIAGWRASRPDLKVEPIAVTARLMRLHATLGPKLESVFQRFGIRGADFGVIATLVRLGDARVSQRRLGLELALSPGTISGRVDRLVAQGFVRRDPDPEDGRGALISLTDIGRELFEACAPEHLANADALVAGLSEHERRQLGTLLGKLLATLEEPATDDRLEPELGVVVEDAPLALERRRAVGLPPLAGVLIRHVHPAGAAAASGLRPGDLITAVNQHAVRSRQDLDLALTDRRGRPLTLELARGSEPIRVRVEAPQANSRKHASP